MFRTETTLRVTTKQAVTIIALCCAVPLDGCKKQHPPPKTGLSPEEDLTQKTQSTVSFFRKFREIDDGAASEFWKCVIHARHRDVRFESSSVLVEGLSYALAGSRQEQPILIKDRCLPMVGRVIQEAAKIAPPSHLAKPFKSYEEALKKVKPAFEAYAGKLSTIMQREGKAMDKPKIREMHPGLAAAELELVRRAFSDYKKGRKSVLKAVEEVQQAVIRQKQSAGGHSTE